MFENINDDDDDAFFTPVSSSNLASLFGVNITPTTSSPANATLTYTAPKQPNAKTDEPSKCSPAKYQSSVLSFKEVHAFKLVEKQYTAQGKCGLALIGNESVHIYQLLLYKQKNDIISTSKVNNLFQFVMQKDNHGSYCDERKQNWTVRFNSEADMNEFVRAIELKGVKVVQKNAEVASAKEKEVPKVDLFKDAGLTDKESVKQIDSDNLSDSSSSNAKANILSRMAKMGQRILLPNTSVSDGTDSETEKDKAVNNKVNRKSKRISPISATTTNASDISTHDNSVLPNAAVAAVSTPVRQTTTTQQYALINGQYVPIVQPQYLPVTADISPVCQSIVPSAEIVSSPVLYTPSAHLNPDQLNMYFVENRTHNSEVRMNIMRLTNKMEEMMEKVNKMDTSPVKTVPNHSSNEDVLKENVALKLVISSLEKSVADMKVEHESEIKQQLELSGKESVLLKQIEEQSKLLAQQADRETELLEKIEHLQLRLVEHQQKTEERETRRLELLMNKEKFSNIDDTIKKTMNVLYQDVCSQFGDYESVQGRDVKTVLAQKIVGNTYSIIAAVKELKFPGNTNVANS